MIEESDSAFASESNGEPSNYLLPNCVVLLAAVFMTRKAYDWAQHVLPIARNAENLKQ